MAFKNEVKSIQTAGYNGALTVYGTLLFANFPAFLRVVGCHCTSGMQPKKHWKLGKKWSGNGSIGNALKFYQSAGFCKIYYRGSPHFVISQFVIPAISWSCFRPNFMILKKKIQKKKKFSEKFFGFFFLFFQILIHFFVHI